MSGIFHNHTRHRLGLAVLALAALSVQAPQELSGASQSPPRVTRKTMMAVARRMAEHKWVCTRTNRKASCSTRYRSRYKENEEVTGVAYDWGGMDNVDAFDKKLANRQAAGSHQEEGVTSCTAGVDCSGLLSLAWGQTRKFGTATIHQIAANVVLDRHKDLKPGDALNKPGSHIVMFAGYHPDGTVSVYEASGGAARVILTRSTWDRYEEFVPVRYAGVVD